MLNDIQHQQKENIKKNNSIIFKKNPLKFKKSQLYLI